MFLHSNASCGCVFSNVNLIKTKPQNQLITDTVNGLMQTLECVEDVGRCTAFKPSGTMLSSSTASNLYHKRTAPSASGTSAEDGAATASDGDSEVELELYL